jgi:hypothetical protein
MDSEQSLVRRRRKPAEVQQLVAEFLSSGIGQDEFCRSHEISRSTLCRHLRRHRNQETQGPATQLIPVQLLDVHQTRMTRCAGLAVLLGNGRKIEVKEGFEAGTLERLLRVLERA